jgi:hypothetical protein
MKLKRIKIITSGGQTGADRAAFDFALAHGLEISGFVPRGRRAEDGPLSDKYPNLRETATRSYAERTRLNVQTSDATLILSHGNLAGGSRLTQEFARQSRKPFLHLDLSELNIKAAARRAAQWLDSIECENLNIAGSRASTDAEIYERTREFLAELFLVK